MKISAAIALVSILPSLPGCALLAPLFDGRETRSDTQTTLHRAAMADYATCMTDPDPDARTAAASRLAQATADMAAITQADDPDHIYHADRVRAAHESCARDRPL